MGNIVAIVGRPNVGKSTLFNRFTQSRRAIVDDEAGTTRDRQYGKCEWNGREFSIIDTGGWVINSTDIFEGEIKHQVSVAIEESDVVLFLVDVQSGITDYDLQVAQILRRSEKPVILVSNKADTYGWQSDVAEFYRLGMGEPFMISSLNGLGTGDLLDELLTHFKPDSDGEEIDKELPRFAVIGRPNVGKSSLINTLMEEERNIVTDIAGTTRDAIYTRFNKFGHDFYLIDTAGIRKKAKVNEDLEYYSVLRSIRAIESADVCILMLDATRGIESQDLNIFSLIQKNKKGLVIVVNKWDLIENKENNSTKKIETSIRERLAPFVDFPIIFTSVTTKQRVLKVLDEAETVFANKNRKVPTSQLNEYLLPAIENYPPPALKGKYVKIKYVTQLPGTYVPTFVFFANLPQYVKEPYRRFLENKIRSKYEFTGTPIQVFIRQK
ncbi:MAG: ribosome biogenesis GTPase Der [Paludibacter sp.]|jgi:GTP-binding protein|nr:ribosome biogenesis GTPase Der [Paludibacter sp.]